MKCPYCGAEVTGAVCPYCESRLPQPIQQKTPCTRCGSTNVSFRRENQGEIRDSNARQIIHRTVGFCNDCGNTWYVDQAGTAPKKRRTWLWVLGWIFIFPVPLMILLLRNKTMKPVLKYGLIAAAWLLYLSISYAGSSAQAARTGDVPALSAGEAAPAEEPAKTETPAPAEEPAKTETPAPAEEPAGAETPAVSDANVPAEYRMALEKAESYVSLLHLSKKDVYDQLTSEYGEQLSAEAAQYAVDHLDVDWKEVALKSAENLNEALHLSKKGLYEQLTSEYGSQFTEEEAQYAIENINADWKANALAKAKSYQESLELSGSELYDQLTSEYGEEFTAEEAQYAMDHLND